MNLQPQQIEALCQELKLPAQQVQWSALAQSVANTQGNADFLLAGLESERAARQERVRQALLKIASLPAIKSLEAAISTSPPRFPKRKSRSSPPSASSSAPENRVTRSQWWKESSPGNLPFTSAPPKWPMIRP